MPVLRRQLPGGLPNVFAFFHGPAFTTIQLMEKKLTVMFSEEVVIYQ